MKLTVVIPCYNERATVQKLLNAVTEAPFPKAVSHTEIVVIDDFSNDGTRDLLKKISENPQSLINLKQNQSFQLIFQTQTEEKVGHFAPDLRMPAVI